LYGVVHDSTEPGTQNPSQVHGPGRRRVDLSIAKSFTIRGDVRLQVLASLRLTF
jgi:hypothetical protein